MKALYTTNWTAEVIYNRGTYVQYYPLATLQKYGTNAVRIWVTWQGTDSTDTTKNNIKVICSDDNWVTLSAVQKLTSGNSYEQENFSITTDLNGNVYVMWHGITTTSSSKYNVRMRKYDGTSWGSIIEITNQNINSIYNPSICDNYYNFEKPMTVWQYSVNSRTAFYGKWTVGQGHVLTMQNPVTLTNNQPIPIVDLIPKQNGIDLIIDNVDSEKFTFKGSNLNATITKIKVNGKDNSLNTLAYAVA